MSKGTTYKQRQLNPRRCSATNREGKPCGAWAIKGGGVCRVHGGSAPQVRRKANMRLDLGVVRDAVHRLRGDPPALGVVDTPATVDPAETAAQRDSPEVSEPPEGSRVPEPPQTPSEPVKAVPPGTGLMGLEQAMADQGFARGRKPPVQRRRRR